MSEQSRCPHREIPTNAQLRSPYRLIVSVAYREVALLEFLHNREISLANSKRKSKGWQIMLAAQTFSIVNVTIAHISLIINQIRLLKTNEL